MLTVQITIKYPNPYISEGRKCFYKTFFLVIDFMIITFSQKSQQNQKIFKVFCSKKHLYCLFEVSHVTSSIFERNTSLSFDLFAISLKFEGVLYESVLMIYNNFGDIDLHYFSYSFTTEFFKNKCSIISLKIAKE